MRACLYPRDLVGSPNSPRLASLNLDSEHGDWEKGPFGMQVVRGDMKPDDKSYVLLTLL